MVAVAGTQPGFNHQGASWPTLTPDQAAMVEANTGLIGHALRLAKVPTAQHEDRWQDGTLGLIRAVQMFEPERGFTFSTYAMHWIRQAIAKGRQTEEGSGYRWHLREGTEYAAPLSMDAPLVSTIEGEEGGNIGNIISAEPDTVERRAIAAAQVAEIRTLVAGWNLDRLGRTLADDLLTPTETSVRQRNVAIALRLGRHPEVVRRRRTLLQARIAAHYQHEAA
jgi:hypothetical protein